MPKVSARQIMAKVKRDPAQKQRTTLYLDAARYEEFKRIVGPASLSQVVDELILQFIESAKDTKRSR
jgi:hypothetical protein